MDRYAIIEFMKFETITVTIFKRIAAAVGNIETHNRKYNRNRGFQMLATDLSLIRKNIIIMIIQKNKSLNQ